MRFEGIKTGSQKRTYKMWILLRTLNFKMGVLQVAQQKIVNSSRMITCLVPVFILETNNQTNNECLPKLVQTDNA